MLQAIRRNTFLTQDHQNHMALKKFIGMTVGREYVFCSGDVSVALLRVLETVFVNYGCCIEYFQCDSAGKVSGRLTNVSNQISMFPLLQHCNHYKISNNTTKVGNRIKRCSPS